MVADAHDARFELHSTVHDAISHDIYGEHHRNLVGAVGVEERVGYICRTRSVSDRCCEFHGGVIGGHTSHLPISPFALENERHISHLFDTYCHTTVSTL